MSAFEELRPQLFGLAYRMLGARADAEDIVQEAYVRWQSTDQSRVRSPRSYLNSIVARLSIDALKSARRKRETYVGTWLPEPIATDNPASNLELADSLSIAFLHVLESLSPDERVAFLMREVFSEDYSEVAQTLETTEVNCRQMVSRARQQIQAKRPRFEVDPERHQAVLLEFLNACVNDDKSTLMGLLREDAILYSDGGGKAAAALNPVYGADRIARFFLAVTKKTTLDASPILAGGIPSVLFHADGVVDSLMNVDLDGEGRVRGIYVIRNPDKLHYSVPTQISAAATTTV